MRRTRFRCSRDGWRYMLPYMSWCKAASTTGSIFDVTRSDWAPDNAFAFHNFWHLALFCTDVRTTIGRSRLR
jgi:hypothetical protein